MKRKSNYLIIIFSAYSKDGAVYNYVRTLKKMNANKLYIKDDFAKNRLGSYYLGENGKGNVEKAVIKLIEKYGKNKVKIFVGSSKGAYAAINFASEFINSICIVGAPQYRIGSHLNQPYFHDMLSDIIGTINDSNVISLDYRLSKKLLDYGKNNIRVLYLQYSSKEEYYFSQIEPLINDLVMLKMNFKAMVLDYSLHTDVHKYFPLYLKDLLTQILSSKNNDA